MKFKEHLAEILMFIVFVTMILLLVFKILLEYQEERDSQLHKPTRIEIRQHNLDSPIDDQIK